MDATDSWGEPLHPERRTTEPVVRVVLAEAAEAPGPLHYLLEGEGFRILGSASDDHELTRLLTQSIQPEVIVVDAAVPATTVMVARELAPGSELIVIWPEEVVPPASADQVLPELVFEDLGPAVHRAADRNRLRRPVVQEMEDIDGATSVEPDRMEPASAAARRTAARVLVGTVALIAAIVVTMGVSFALEGWRASHLATPARTPIVTPSKSVAGRSSPTGSVQRTTHPSRNTNAGCGSGARTGPNDHAANHAKQHAADCPSQAGGGNRTNGGPTTGSGANSGTGAGSGHGSGQGSGQGSGHGSGQGSSSSHAPGDHPTGQPSTPPAAGDHAGQKASQQD